MANNKNITFDQLHSSMTKVKSELDKKANSNHGTHVEYYDENPKVAGTTTAGSSSKLSRGDHVHPAQTTITGNAGTATTLATARTLTIGNTGKPFNGSANVSWSLNEIGAAPNTHSHNILNIKGSNTISSTTNDTTANWVQQNNSVHWYSTAEQITNQPSQYGFLVNLASGGDVHQIWMTQSAGNMYHRGGNGSGWSGDTWRTILDSSNFTSYSPTLSGGGATGTWGISISGNASTATKLQTARTLTIGKTEKSFNGTGNVSWTLNEIGAQPANSLTIKTVSNRILTLGTELYQYAEITSNNTIINLPSVSSFTEIHLFFDWPSGISIIMPSNVKWQEGVMYGPGYTHEFIFTYINSTIGWVGGCVVYG